MARFSVEVFYGALLTFAIERISSKLQKCGSGFFILIDNLDIGNTSLQPTSTLVANSCSPTLSHIVRDDLKTLRNILTAF